MDLHNSIRKNMDKQKAAVIKEADSSGSFLIHSDRKESDNFGSTGRSLTNIFKSFAGGKITSSAYDTLIFSGKGIKHAYIQPYSENVTLPGEHHAILDVCFPFTIKVIPSWWMKRSNLQIFIVLGIISLGLFFLLGLHKPRIITSDKSYSAKLSKNRSLSPLLKGIKANWPVGSSNVELDWLIQIRNLGNGKSHIVMKSGRYGGFATYGVGMKKFTEICSSLKSISQEETGSGRYISEPFYSEPAYSHAALTHIS